jgi:hypothetical protein
LDGVFSAVVVDQPKLSRLRLFGTIAERDREREREREKRNETDNDSLRSMSTTVKC